MADQPEFKIGYDVIDDDLANQKLRIELPKVDPATLDVTILEPYVAGADRPLTQAKMDENTYYLYRLFVKDSSEVSGEEIAKAADILSDTQHYCYKSNIKGGHKETLLFLAAANGHDYAMDALLDAATIARTTGTDFTMHNEYGFKPIHAAIVNGHQSIAKKLWQNHACDTDYRINSEYSLLNGLMPYHLTLLTHQFELADWAEKSVSSNLPHESSHITPSTIKSAIMYNNKQALNYAINKNVSTEPDQRGDTLVHYAALKCVNNAMFDYVMDHKALHTEPYINQFTLSHATPLLAAVDTACKTGDLHKVNRLLALGASPDLYYSDLEATMLLFYAMREATNVVKNDENAVDYMRAVLRTLLEHGANPNIKFEFASFAEECVLQALTYFDQMAMEGFTLLLESGMRIKPTDSLGRSLFSDDAFDGYSKDPGVNYDDFEARKVHLLNDIIAPFEKGVQADIAKLPEGCTPKLLLRAYAVGMEGEVAQAMQHQPGSLLAAMQEAPQWLQETPHMQQQVTRLASYVAQSHPGNSVTGWSVGTLAKHAQGQGV